jgi:hypothetical protein
MAENECQCFADLTADKCGVIHHEQEHALSDIIIIIIIIIISADQGRYQYYHPFYQKYK